VQLDFGGPQVDGVAIVRGFATALGCQLTGSHSSSGSDVSVRAIGQKVYFEALYVVSNNHMVGRVTFEDIVLRASVAEAVRNEALAQF